MGDVGVNIGVGLDPGNAKEGLSDLEKDLSGFGAGAQKAGDDTDKALLSNRESVRLLSEEFGVHLPRAVSGAVAEMIPAISAVGPVLLGAFAIKEIPALVRGIQEGVSAWEGFGKAEQAAMQKAIEDTAKLHGEVLNVEEELEQFGKTEAEQAAKRAQWAGEDADRALKSLLDAEDKERAIKEKIAGVKEDLNAFTAGLGRIYVSQLEQQEAQTAKLREAWKLAEGEALVAQKRAAEALENQTDKTEKQAKALKDVQYEVMVTSQQLLPFSKVLDGVTNAIDVDVKSINLWANSLKGADLIFSDIDRQLVSTNTILDQGAIHLSAYAEVMDSAKGIMKDFGEATAQSTIATMMQGLYAHETFAKVAKEAIKSIAEQAGIQAVWEAAQGFAMLALSFFIPDPRYVASADAHFTAAAIYGGIGGVAAGVSAAIHAPGGGGGGAAAGYHGGAGSGGSGELPMQTIAPGAGGGVSGTLHVHIMGETQAGEWLASTLTNAVNRGVTLMATSSQRGAPVGH